MDEWDKYQLLVLSDLKELKGSVGELEGKVNEALIQIATLKVKASMWGLIGGSVPVLIAIGIEVLRRKS